MIRKSAAPLFAGFAALCFAPAAREAQAKPTVAPAKTTLTIPALPNARVQLELDATEKDLLGMVKSFVRGLEKSNAQAGRSNQIFLRLLADKQFSDVLKDIHHLHVVVYDLNENESSVSSSTMSSSTMSGMTMSDGITVTPSASPAAPVQRVPEALAWYDRPFRAEGGQRVLKADFKSARAAIYGFQKPGFALVLSSSSRIIVARADAYLDMEALGRMIEFTDSEPAKSATTSATTSAKPIQKSASKTPSSQK